MAMHPLYLRAAPMFEARARLNPRFSYGSIHNAYNLLVFVGSLNRPGAQACLSTLRAQQGRLFNDAHCRLFVVINQVDEAQPLTQDALPGVRHFIDTTDETLAQLFALKPQGAEASQPCAFITDTRGVVVYVQPLGDDGATDATRLCQAAAHFMRADNRLPILRHAPVVAVPRVFEPQLCQALMAYYQKAGGKESGVTRARTDGVTYTELAYDFKRRQDCQIEDDALRKALIARVNARLLPQVFKSFQFSADRIERHIIGRYAAEDKAFFRAHRDNTTKGTAHRRFAVTINLNAEDYDGGDLSFPEFGEQTYRCPTGGAVVFSCSLLHQVSTVTRGVRYAYLPFLYTAADQAIREKNSVFLDLPE